MRVPIGAVGTNRTVLTGSVNLWVIPSRPGAFSAAGTASIRK